MMQSRRLILWMPVFFGIGAILYYALPFEPQLAYSAVPLVASAVALRLAWRLGWRRRFWALLLFLSLVCGFLWTQSYTLLHPVTMLTKEVRISDVSGRIIEISDVPKGYRITLDDVTIEGLPPEQTPQRVRLKMRGEASGQGLMTGQHIALRAGLLPPSGPVMPQAFDFARYFYFKGIGAVGYGLPPATVLTDVQQRSMWMQLAAVREAMSRRIRAQLPPEEGAVAAALMMGDRAAIPEAVNDAMRDTNLSHILAISGMHMALVTGLVFFALRWLMVALPLTRHVRSPKKLAAWIALAAGAGYLVLAGFPVSACRAFVMVALVFAAILLDRQVMPMRSLAVAALVLLLVNPSYAMQPGFQLSFLATAALIAWYERVRRAGDEWFEPQARHKRALLYLGGVLGTSFIAEISTAPLVLYHFNSIAFWGLLANLMIMPIVSFWIMPSIVLAFMLWPLGLEGLMLAPAGWGISAMIALAQWTAALPHAQMFAPSLPGWGMAIVSLGMLWMIVWQGKRRFWGLAAIAAGLMSLLTVQSPDLLISADGKQIAGRIGGELVQLKGRSGGFISEQWANGAGYKTLAYPPKESDAWRCEKGYGCVYRSENTIIALPETFEAQAEDCRKADLVISPFYVRQSECAVPVVDRRARDQGGAHWLWLEKGTPPRLQFSRDLQGARPWSAGR